MEQIECRICGAKVHAMAIHLRDDHPDTTLEEYQAKYPDAPLLSEIAKKRIEEKRRKAESEKESAEMAKLEAASATSSRKEMHVLFNLGKAKAAMRPDGTPVMVEVLDDGDWSMQVPEIDPNYIFPIDQLKTGLSALALKIPAFFWGHAGTGKCLGKDTPVLMFNGTTKLVQDVKEGDLVMGPDSMPRRVVGLARGQEMLYRIVPTKGEPYIVNESHILSLKTGTNAEHYIGEKSNSIVNISVRDYLKKSKAFKHNTKGWRTGVDFDANSESLRLDPYYMGLWIGDGNKRDQVIWSADEEVKDYLESYAALLGMKVRYDQENETSGLAAVTICDADGEATKGSHPIRQALKYYGVMNNKHIPHAFKTATRQERLELLAGIIDTDGSLSCGGYEVTQKLEQVADDICFVARSLGFAAYKTETTKACTNASGRSRVEGTYYRVFISGEVSEIPVKIGRKVAEPRKQSKDVLKTGITVEEIGVGDYYGFELQGNDRLFLLGDFTVTHNTTLWEQICAKTNRPMIRIQHTGATEESHILGSMAANVDGTYFDPGPLPLAMKYGWIYLADEYDAGFPQSMMVYQPVLEGKPLVIKEAPADSEWRVVHPHPNFLIVATGNTNMSGDESGLYQGTNIQNAANAERFGIVEEMPYMPKKQETAVVAAQGGISREDAERLVEFAHKVRDAYNGKKIKATLGPRVLINAAKIAVARASFMKGLEFAFINRLSTKDREVVTQLAQRILV